MAAKPAAGAPGKPPVGTPAASSVAAYGGNRGGRPRKDGLAPGSPEADEADRKKNRDDKRLSRQTAAKVAEPPPLPSAVTSEPGATPSPTPNLSPNAPGADPPPVPWQPETLTGLVDQLVEAAEENRVGNYLARCAEAGLTPKLTKEIEKDAHFPPIAKTLLKQAIPRLSAKWLNRTGLSAEWQDEISVLTAIILIVKQNAQTNARFEELIQANKQPAKKPAEAKP